MVVERCLVVVIGLLGIGCGGATGGQAHAQLVERARAHTTAADPYRALADYQQAAIYQRDLDPAVEAERQAAGAAVISSEIARAEAEQARGEPLVALTRLVDAQVAIRTWQLAPVATLAPALRQAALAVIAAGKDDLAALRALELIATATLVPVDAEREALRTRLRAHHLQRADEAGAGAWLARDLHLRIASKLLGAELPHPVAVTLGDIAHQLTVPIDVVPATGACASLIDELAERVDNARGPATELTLTARFDLTCTYSEEDTGNEIVPRARVLVATGSVRLGFLGGSEALPVNARKYYGTDRTVTDASDRQFLIYPIAEWLAGELSTAQGKARTRLAERAHADLGSGFWQKRDAAAVAAWNADADPSAVEALRKAYGLDRAALAAMYDSAPIPPLHASNPTTLPEPDEVPAAAALAREGWTRPGGGDAHDDTRQQRWYDVARPHVGLAYRARRSPLAEVAREHTASASLWWLSFDLTRHELGGDADGWGLALTPRLAKTERLILEAGLRYDTVRGVTPEIIDGPPGNVDQAASSFATVLRAYVALPPAILDVGAELNLLQVFGGTGSPPDTQHFSTVGLGAEIPLPWPFYLRGEGRAALGAEDTVQWGLTVGARKVFHAP